MTTTDRFGGLRALLQKPPSEAVWREIVDELVSRSVDEGGFDVRFVRRHHSPPLHLRYAGKRGIELSEAEGIGLRRGHVTKG